jgi:hypothetical protein
MRRYSLWLGLGLCALLALTPAGYARGSFAYAQVTPVPDIMIVAPQPGQALQGVVSIMGRTSVSAFRSAEVLFGYANDPSQTWFFITESTTPVEAGLLAEWDTSTLTDGNYTLRLVVNRTDKSRVVMIVPGLRIRNYSPVETDTPAPISTPAASATSLPGDGPQPTKPALPSATSVPPTITPLPPNPAVLSSGDITDNFLRGAVGTGIALAALGLYLAIRKLFYR